MNEEEIKKIIDDTYDDSREDNLLSMVGQLYSEKMVPSMIVHFAYSLPFMVGAVFCGIKFFKTDQTQYQIMHAAIFVCCIQFCIFSKAKYWQMLYKINTSREIKRLELRIAELNETVKNK
ncbi:MAG: hypothetical protein GY774_17625 [Planctomycetes bacterium]|nr:hypothetical protein [Planctomycetota bacterium]